MTAPDPAVVVQGQLFPPGPQPADAITMYEGATQAKNGFAPWRAWDVRGPFLKLAWDLLRFQVPTAPSADATLPVGLRDSVNQSLFLAKQNNQILRALAKAGNVDISAITGA